MARHTPVALEQKLTQSFLCNLNGTKTVYTNEIVTVLFAYGKIRHGVLPCRRFFPPTLAKNG